MQDNLASAIAFVKISEGGYGNDAHDPGGPTNLGVTQAEYNSYRRNKGLPCQSVRLITPAEMAEIFKTNYWDTVSADALPAGLDYAVADGAYNEGPHQAIKDLQRAVNDVHDKKLTVDGILGNQTLDFIHDCDTAALIKAYCSERMGLYRILPGWRWFGVGWTHRIYGQAGDPGVLKNALGLLAKATAPAPEKAAA